MIFDLHLTAPVKMVCRLVARGERQVRSLILKSSSWNILPLYSSLRRQYYWGEK